MPPLRQFDWLLKVVTIAMIVTVALACVAIVVTVAMGVTLVLDDPTWSNLMPVVVAMACEVGLALWAVVAYGLVTLFVNCQENAETAIGRLGTIESLVSDQAVSSKELASLGKLSDKAKSLVFREGEIDAFNEAVHADLFRQDYKAAEILIEDVEKKFGYTDEARRLRNELEASKKTSLDEKIDAAVARIMAIVENLDWQRATRETQRVMKLFPDNPKISSLTERIQQARMQRKRQLLQEYDAAVRKNDVDTSITVLKELDLYLTPQEGAALAESARGVFKVRLHNLGVQFAIRTTDQQWAESIAVGQEIIQEFPNSRMAQEVREKLSVLREKAAEQAQLLRQAKEQKQEREKEQE